VANFTYNFYELLYPSEALKYILASLVVFIKSSIFLINSGCSKDISITASKFLATPQASFNFLLQSEAL